MLSPLKSYARSFSRSYILMLHLTVIVKAMLIVAMLEGALLAVIDHETLSQAMKEAFAGDHFPLFKQLLKFDEFEDSDLVLYLATGAARLYYGDRLYCQQPAPVSFMSLLFLHYKAMGNITAYVNNSAVDKDGSSPLMLVVKCIKCPKQKLEMVKLFLCRGADVYHANYKGETVLDYCRTQNIRASELQADQKLMTVLTGSVTEAESDVSRQSSGSIKRQRSK